MSIIHAQDRFEYANMDTNILLFRYDTLKEAVNIYRDIYEKPSDYIKDLEAIYADMGNIWFEVDRRMRKLRLLEEAFMKTGKFARNKKAKVLPFKQR